MIGVYYSDNNRGPGKVASNLLKGLEKGGVSHAVNQEGKYNLILQSCPRLYQNLNNCIIGPNICTLPFDSPVVMAAQNYATFIVPSLWVYNLCTTWLPPEKMKIWPVGIDTDAFPDVSEEKKHFDCLIYYKNRSIKDLNFTKKTLTDNNQSFKVITYGEYSEDLFRNLLREARYSLILDNTESQGIAIQEIMSSNLPLLVWDMTYWDHRGAEYTVPATSIPYWSEECGEIITHKAELNNGLLRLLHNFKSKEPRKYIKENLNLKDQALKIRNLFKGRI